MFRDRDCSLFLFVPVLWGKVLMAVRHQMNVVRSERMCPGTLEAFSLPIGGGAPCREAGGTKKEVRKDPCSKVGPPSSPGEMEPAAMRFNGLKSVGISPLFKETNRTGRIPV